MAVQSVCGCGQPAARLQPGLTSGRVAEVVADRAAHGMSTTSIFVYSLMNGDERDCMQCSKQHTPSWMTPTQAGLQMADSACCISNMHLRRFPSRPWGKKPPVLFSDPMVTILQGSTSGLSALHPQAGNRSIHALMLEREDDIRIICQMKQRKSWTACRRAAWRLTLWAACPLGACRPGWWTVCLWLLAGPAYALHRGGLLHACFTTAVLQAAGDP